MLTSQELPSSDLLVEGMERLHGFFMSQGFELVITDPAAGPSDETCQASDLQRLDLKLETSPGWQDQAFRDAVSRTSRYCALARASQQHVRSFPSHGRQLYL